MSGLQSDIGQSSSGSVVSAGAVHNIDVFPTIRVETPGNGDSPRRLDTGVDPIYSISRTEKRFQFIGTYMVPCHITLGGDRGNEEIRYTFSGKNPTHKSRLYTGVLIFHRNMTGGDNTVLKCRLYNKNNHMIRGSVTTFEFRVFTNIGR